MKKKIKIESSDLTQFLVGFFFQIALFLCHFNSHIYYFGWNSLDCFFLTFCLKQNWT